MTLKVPCPAKINLTLSVGPPARGPDDAGLHPIASWMALINLSDSLELERSRGERSSFSMRFADDAPRRQTVDWPLEKDLIYRAHVLMERAARRALHVDATLTKRIPTGAGLGGGSSDAAAMMRGLTELFGLDFTTEDLVSLSRELGSDIAFFASGASSAIVTGQGDHVEPLPQRDLNLVLILPPLSCPTGPVYRAFDELGGAQLNETHVRTVAGLDPLPADALFNDLAAAAMTVEPRLADLGRRVADALQTPVHVTGSGAAMFALAPGPDAAEQMAATVRNHTQVIALAARTTTPP